MAKKNAKRSVDRNYMRRVLREFFRKQQMDIGPIDVVLRVQKIFHHQEYEVVAQEFDDLLFRLKRATKKDLSPSSSETQDA